MKSYTTGKFWALYHSLSSDMQKRADEAYVRFTHDPFHPGLNFEEVGRKRDLWSARISRNYRALGIREGDEITWFWIGTPHEYEKLIKGH